MQQQNSQNHSVHLGSPANGAESLAEAAHTPGPWKWYWRVEDGEVNCGVLWEQREGVAHSVCRAPRYVTREQWEANARLIAAAPTMHEELKAQRAINAELLEALKTLKRAVNYRAACVLSGDPDQMEFADQRLWASIDRADTAIAKAQA